MSATGLDVFDKTLQTTNGWLDEIMRALGPDRAQAWRVLGLVLRAVRDRLPLDLAAHLGAELPLLVRGAYYDQFRPEIQPLTALDDAEALYARLRREGRFARPVDPQAATQAVFAVLSLNLPHGQVDKVRESLPRDLRAMWAALEDRGGRAPGGEPQPRPTL